jgi:altronate dehydratase large subunit
VALIKTTVTGTQTKSEELGHREFILTYKTFEQAGPTCLPRAAQPGDSRS